MALVCHTGGGGWVYNPLPSGVRFPATPTCQGRGRSLAAKHFCAGRLLTLLCYWPAAASVLVGLRWCQQNFQKRQEESRTNPKSDSAAGALAVHFVGGPCPRCDKSSKPKIDALLLKQILTNINQVIRDKMDALLL